MAASRVMKRTLALTAVAPLAAICLAGCSSNASKPSDATPSASSPKAAKVGAAAAFKSISATVNTAKLSGTVTAENDPNHLLGRPSQYTSKITFTDSRVSPADRAGHNAGDIELGGAIETFASAIDASTRAKYIQTVTKGMPMLSEYDYVHGTVVVRVSRYLTPQQAAQYKAAAAKLP